MSGTNVPYTNRYQKGGQNANHSRDMDYDAEFSGNLYIA